MAEILTDEAVIRGQTELLLRERDLRKTVRRVCALARDTVGVSGEQCATLDEKARAVRAAMKDFHDCAETLCNSGGIQPLTGGTEKPDEE